MFWNLSFAFMCWCIDEEIMKKQWLHILSWNLDTYFVFDWTSTELLHLTSFTDLVQKQTNKQTKKQREKWRRHGSSFHLTLVYRSNGLCTEKEHEISSHVYAADVKKLTSVMSASGTFACASRALSLFLSHWRHTHISLCLLRLTVWRIFFSFLLLRLAKATVIQQCRVFKVLPFSLNHCYCFT